MGFFPKGGARLREHERGATIAAYGFFPVNSLFQFPAEKAGKGDLPDNPRITAILCERRAIDSPNSQYFSLFAGKTEPD